MNEPRIQLDEVLDAVMCEEKEPAYGALQRWAERYPEFSDDLADFFAAWAVQIQEGDTGDINDIDEEGLANRLVSHALGTIHAKRAAASAVHASDSEQVRLLAYANSLGLSAPVLAARTRLDEDLLAKLDLRRLTDVPELCLALLYAALGSVKGSVRLMLTGPPLLPLGASYKAKRRPTPVTEDFLTAVARSMLSDESKAFWKAVVAAEQSRTKANECMD